MVFYYFSAARKIFLWLQAKASREERKCLRVGTCPHSITAPPAALFSVLLRQWKDIHTSIHPPGSAFVQGVMRDVQGAKWIIARPHGGMGNEADSGAGIRGKKWQDPWDIHGMLLDIRKSLWKEAVVTHEMDRNDSLVVSAAKEALSN